MAGCLQLGSEDTHWVKTVYVTNAIYLAYAHIHIIYQVYDITVIVWDIGTEFLSYYRTCSPSVAYS